MIVLRFSDLLDQEIADEGIVCEDFFDLCDPTESIYYDACDMPYPVIHINSARLDTEVRRNYRKLHELGHHHTCALNLFEASAWLQNKYEYLADRHWSARVLSPARIAEAYDSGVRSPMDLAEYLDLPLDAVLRGAAMQYQANGPVSEYGKYRIFWNPLNVKINHRKK